MIILSETTDNLQVVLTGAITTNQLQCTSSWRERTSSTFVAGRTLTNTNNTTDVTIVPAPSGASTQRIVDLVNIYNNDTVTAEVTIKFDANGTEYILWKGSLASGQSIVYAEGRGWEVLDAYNSVGYTLAVICASHTPVDGQVIYFGSNPKVPTTNVDYNKVFIPKTGRIKRIEIFSNCGTAGTAEDLTLNVVINNTTTVLIDTVSTSSSNREFINTTLNEAVNAGDYVEIQVVQPTWATNPSTMTYGGHIYIE